MTFTCGKPYRLTIIIKLCCYEQNTSYLDVYMDDKDGVPGNSFGTILVSYTKVVPAEKIDR